MATVAPPVEDEPTALAMANETADVETSNGEPAGTSTPEAVVDPVGIGDQPAAERVVAVAPSLLPFVRPDWASEVGNDSYGSYAMLQLGGATMKMRYRRCLIHNGPRRYRCCTTCNSDAAIFHVGYRGDAGIF